MDWTASPLSAQSYAADPPPCDGIQKQGFGRWLGLDEWGHEGGLSWWDWCPCQKRHQSLLSTPVMCKHVEKMAICKSGSEFSPANWLVLWSWTSRLPELWEIKSYLSSPGYGIWFWLPKLTKALESTLMRDSGKHWKPYALVCLPDLRCTTVFGERHWENNLKSSLSCYSCRLALFFSLLGCRVISRR